MMSMAWAEALLDFFFPPRCPLCHAYVESRGGWCADCLQAALDVRQLALPQGTALTAAWAMALYHEGVDGLIKDLKYRGKRSTLPYFRALLEAGWTHLPENMREGGQGWLAVPVPLFYAKEKRRGFNQTELIFRDFLQEKGWQYQRLLQRQRETRPLYELSARERAENLKGAFAVAEGVENLAGKKILLLDDILTTGSTLQECAKVLKKAGATTVCALVLASDHQGVTVY